MGQGQVEQVSEGSNNGYLKHLRRDRIWTGGCGRSKSSQKNSASVQRESWRQGNRQNGEVKG